MDRKYSMLNVKKSTNIYRVEEDIMGSTITGERFNSQEETDRLESMMARILKVPSGFWVFQKTLVDEILDQTLDKKPEEKLWIVVATHRLPDFNFPTIRLKKFDLFKVGRVRFKVREIVSPFYREENRINEEISEKYRAQYPMKEPSIH
jgi:hypothetical protein